MRSLDGARILVTGGAGFLGFHTVKRMVEMGARVTVLDHGEFPNNSFTSDFLTKIDVVKADITDRIQMASCTSKVEYIIHLAAASHPKRCTEDPATAFSTNVYGTYNVLENALANHAKVIYGSSAHVYGISPAVLPTDETILLSPNDEYALTKTLGEHACQYYYRSNNLEYVSLRIYNGYGPAQSTDFFIPATIKMAKTGKIVLRGRRTTKDFIYVDDIVDAIIASCKSHYVGDLNIGSGVETSLEKIGLYVADKMNAKIEFVDDDLLPSHMQSSIKKAEQSIDWKCKTSLYEGLDRTMSYFKMSEK